MSWVVVFELPAEEVVDVAEAPGAAFGELDLDVDALHDAVADVGLDVVDDAAPMRPHSPGELHERGDLGLLHLGAPLLQECLGGGLVRHGSQVVEQRFFWFPRSSGNPALSAPAVGYAALERRGRHSHAGAWERENK